MAIDTETHNGLANQKKYKYTWLAILLSIVASALFYVLYKYVFTFFVEAFAEYDTSYATGIGAFILIAVAPSLIGSLSGVIVAMSIFKSANPDGVFYTISTLLVLGSAMTAISAFINEDIPTLFTPVPLIIAAATIYVIRLYLVLRVGR